MATGITQIEDPDRERTILRIEGSLTLTDAELIERLCTELREQTHLGISIDLTDLSFLDSEGASVLFRLKQQGVMLEGLHMFIQKAIELAERSDAA